MNKSTQSLTGIALQKFKKNFWGVFSFGFIVLLMLLSIFAYVLAPDNSENANWGDLTIRSKKPGFEVKILSIPLKEQAESGFWDFFLGAEQKFSKEPISDFKIEKNKIVYTLYNDDPEVIIQKETTLKDFPGYDNLEDVAKDHIKNQKFYLGTDKAGRDYLSRMLVGSRVSIAIGFVAVFISLVVGLFFGALGGYYGGKVDAFVMWLVNIIWSIPTLLLVIAITLSLGKGFWQVFVAVGLTMWVEVARVVRGQIISVKEMQYVTAAKALGYTNWRIILHHILPNIMAPVIVISAANFASAILVESGLSFLGLGAQPPVPSWGGMIKDYYGDIILDKPYLAMVPGTAIMLLTLAFMMMGNALRDALDVKN